MDNIKTIKELPKIMVDSRNYFLKKPIIVKLEYSKLDNEYLAIVDECNEFGYGENEDAAIVSLFLSLLDLYEDLAITKDECLGKTPLCWKNWLLETIGKKDNIGHIGI